MRRGVSALRPENTETIARALYHEPYDRVAYAVTCHDVMVQKLMMQTFEGNESLDRLQSLHLSIRNVDSQSGLPTLAIEDPSAKSEIVYIVRYSMWVDKILALQSQAPSEPEYLVVQIPFIFYSEAEVEEWLQTPPFLEGKSYLVLGRYKTEGEAVELNGYIGQDGKFSRDYNNKYPWTGGMLLLPPDYEFQEQDTLHAHYLLEKNISLEEAYVQIDVPVDEFLDDPANGYWKQCVERINITNHSVVVLSTDDLWTVHSFHQNKQNIIKGRVFTRQEYAKGARVCVVGETFAKMNKLRVGDQLTLQFYPGGFSAKRFEYDATDNLSMVTRPMLYNSSIGMSDPVGYEIVGIFSSKIGILSNRDWDSGDYALTANTVVVPDMSIPSSSNVSVSFQEKTLTDSSLYTLTMKNANAQAFFDEMQEKGYGRSFILLDQGYSSVVPGLKVIRNNAGLMLGICVVAWISIAILFLLLFVQRQRKEAGVLLSLGAGKRRTIRHLVLSVAVVALLSGVLSAGVGILLYEKAFDVALDTPTMESTRVGLFSELPVAVGNDAERAEKLKEFFNPEDVPILVLGIVGFQTVALCLAAWLLARKMVQVNPMELVRSKEG